MCLYNKYIEFLFLLYWFLKNRNKKSLFQHLFKTEKITTPMG